MRIPNDCPMTRPSSPHSSARAHALGTDVPVRS